MPLTENDLQSWTVESLKLYLNNRGVPVSGKGNRKCQLIQKVLAADLLNLPEKPSVKERNNEILQRRASKLTVGHIKIPFPDELELGWMKDFTYLPDLTLGNLKDYATKRLCDQTKFFSDL